MLRLLFSISVLALTAVQASSERPDPGLTRLAREAAEAQKTGICNVHRIAMQKKSVPIIFADFHPHYFHSAYWYDMQRHFPNALEYVQIPGAIQKPQGKRLPHYVCRECKRVQIEWALKHPNDQCIDDVAAHR